MNKFRYSKSINIIYKVIKVIVFISLFLWCLYMIFLNAFGLYIFHKSGDGVITSFEETCASGEKLKSKNSDVRSKAFEIVLAEEYRATHFIKEYSDFIKNRLFENFIFSITSFVILLYYPVKILSIAISKKNHLHQLKSSSIDDVNGAAP